MMSKANVFATREQMIDALDVAYETLRTVAEWDGSRQFPLTLAAGCEIALERMDEILKGNDDAGTSK